MAMVAQTMHLITFTAKCGNILKKSLGSYCLYSWCYFFVLAFAAWFSSAFQTMGLNHKRYTPIIKLQACFSVNCLCAVLL